MSQPSAIAAVTETLRALIAAEGEVASVSALPPDQATGPGDRRVNLFLYHLGIDTALRNQEFPWQGRGGGDSQANPPPLVLPLQLHYLLTVYADDEVAAHGALGPAMRVLHDHAQLTEQEIRDAAANAGLDSDLHLQPEKVKVTPLNMSTDEMMKIWTAFQSAYRLSVAYEVSVVLIESQRPAFSPRPVLRRGAEDRGPVAIPGSGAPVITALWRANGSSPFTTGFAGDEVIIEGVNLGAAPRVRLRRVADQKPASTTPLIATRIAADEPGGSATAERCKLTLTAADLPAAGPLALCIEVPDAVQPVEDVPDPDNPGATIQRERKWHSNEVTLGIAPRLTAQPTAAVAAGDATITLFIEPPVFVDPVTLEVQSLVLILDGQETAVSHVVIADLAAPEFTVASPGSGSHSVWLRVDGVDLPAIMWDAAGKFWVFDSGKQVVIP